MGSSFSAIAHYFPPTPNPNPNPCLGDLPEDCVALILSRLDPQQICRLATLNRAFRRASLSDAVWESKLPENYKLVVEKLFGDGMHHQVQEMGNKRRVYAMLSRVNSFDNATKVAPIFIPYSHLELKFGI